VTKDASLGSAKNRQRRRTAARQFGLAIALLLMASARLDAQDSRSAPDSASAPDSLALHLIDRARAARGHEAEGLRAYEAVVRERLYAGLTARSFRRERGLLRSERVARVRWERDGAETVRWLGIRHDVPIAGDAARVDNDRPEPLDTYPLDPTGDRLRLGDESFLHPLSDSAEAHYRFVSGDTMRIEIPAIGREITMVEVRFSPPSPDFRLLAGSLWFDLETAALIRGVFRPSREFNLEIDEPEDADAVPGFLKPITIAVDAIIVEYGLYDLRWWLAHRIRFEGVARVASLATLPVTIETVASEIEVEGDRLSSEDDPPDGWTRFVEESGDANDEPVTEDGRVRRPPPRRRVVYYPPTDSLRTSPYLTDGWFDSGSDAFSDEELAWMRDQLDALAPQAPGLSPSGTAIGGWRYNRVEALSGAVRAWGPVGSRWQLAGSARLGIGDLEPNAEIEAARPIGGARLSVRGYRTLRNAADMESAFGLAASASALLLGYDDGQYFRATGGEVGITAERGRLRWDAGLFAEHHSSVEKETDASLANLIGDATMPANLAAERIDVYGLAARVRTQFGVDPDGWIGLASLWGEAAGGDRDYGRLGGSAGVSRPITGPLAGALALRAGTSWGDLPVQRQWMLGGPATLRAFPGGALSGAAFWTGRLELAYGLRAVRLIAFGDMGWAGPTSAFDSGRPAASAGLGVSALDGILRVDVARVLRGRSPERIRVHLYLDGLL
jgi:hypothetical protein